MPIARGAVHLARFKFEGALPKDVKRWLKQGLTRAAFEPIDIKSDDERAAGFVELEQHSQTEFSAGALFSGTYAVFAWRVETLKVPTQAVRAGLLSWSQAFEQKNGRPPGRRERAEQKDTLKKALRAKQEPSTKIFEVSFELDSKEVLVWSSSRNAIDDIAAALEGALDIRLTPRVPAAHVSASLLDTLSPTPELFEEVLP